MRLTFTCIVTMLTALFYACHRPGPVPERTLGRGETITTIGLVITNKQGFCDTFVYKERKNAANDSPTHLYGETIMLQPHTTYDVSVILLDERPDSVRDVTRQITAGADSHLFLFRNRPLYQPGVIDVHRGSKDHDGRPFNGRVKFTTGEIGNSVMNVQLLHNPQDKHTNWQEAKGILDAKAKYPVVITNFVPQSM